MSFLKKLLLIFILLLLIPYSTYAQHGYAFFRYECIDQGIRFFPYGTAPIEIRLEQIAPYLSNASLSQQNQFIMAVGEIEVWALQSNEIQIHFSTDIDGTKLVVPAETCGGISESQSVPAGLEWAYAQSSGGNAIAEAGTFEGILTAQAQVNGIGYAVAMAEALPWGSVVAIVQANGGFAYALAQVMPSGQIHLLAQASDNAEASALAWTPSGTNTHIVSSGETLYGIAMCYNTTVELLALLNGLEDPTLIHAGLVLRVP